MISLATIRAAVLSEQPWTKLDAIVRAEMAVGRKVKEIFSDLKAIKDEVWDTPGLSEDGEDAFGDTLDALTGNCRREYCYEDPPKPPTLPTEKEIAKLPRWARIAFAARCARRVLPFYPRYLWPAPPRDQTDLLESSVRGAELGIEPEIAAKLLIKIGDLYNQCIDIAQKSHSPALDSARVVDCVGGALQFRSRIHLLDDADQVRNCFGVVSTAWNLASDLRGGIISLGRDFDHLARLMQSQRWTDDTPVPSTVFGPLWPEGAPAGWPADPDPPKREELPLGYLVKDGVLPVVVVDEVVNLFNALNRYHIARCGVRLTLEGDIFTLLTALVPVGGVR